MQGTLASGMGATHSWWMRTDTWHACLRSKGIWYINVLKISKSKMVNTRSHAVEEPFPIIFSKKFRLFVSFPCKIISNKLYLFTNWVWNCHLFFLTHTIKNKCLKDSNGLPQVSQLPSLHNLFSTNERCIIQYYNVPSVVASHFSVFV